jgi:cholera toxin transcriptional activator
VERITQAERMIPAERTINDISAPSSASVSQPPIAAQVSGDPAKPEAGLSSAILATPHELPKISQPVAQTLFVLFHLMYLAFYVGALANLPEIEELVSPLPRANIVFIVIIVTAAILIPVRAFVLTAVLFRAPRASEKLLKIWRFLLPLDELWALSPFLLLHHIDFGLALSCTPLLVYSPFAQRSLILMGACGVARESSQPV